ncbi:hypothetical protein EMIHUDRAFT_449829 [Emiliania huxleyi CCMP1516]|uniref:SGS domain-containing protein n=2 Tax=Emiliania huxleyi TaxID=2903 RepID=A0A0D3K0E9_EMIH1|nr:hypothetical protein EMIHUDRAFT_449829 [Emiliania huxleyi CCMP1516]EOD29234.1 hypothetical protein EMIHUDRAFT_449829 [Emiliania huxleyi CCMP1516]|eukprot:XP_005781663.1 hypothetical protein EMIHUDRAFT_449829 [Emiliania huxleyi CCMP1516]
MQVPLDRANALFVDEDFDGALAQYNAAVAAEPDSGEALAKRAACNLKLGRHRAAASDAAAASHVVVSVLARNVPPDAAAVSFADAAADVAIELGPDAGTYRLALSLFARVRPDGCSFRVMPWERLEGDGTGGATAFNTAAASDTAPRTVYSGSRRDWDAIDREVTRAEEEEKPEGEEALNKLFQQIYGNASEESRRRGERDTHTSTIHRDNNGEARETRRAMNKSFQTSGGTVLSTNWSEVKEKDYEKERTAPDGQEWKKWG